jgi:hypothetical protein
MCNKYWWVIKLGRFNILTKVSLLSQYQASPQQGLLKALYLIANYLSCNTMCRIVFNSRMSTIDELVFWPGDWCAFYGDISEEDPPNMPVPLENPLNMACFVHVDHACNTVTQHSHTRIIIFLQNAPIQIFSKCQNMCESISYGSEFVAKQIARDLSSLSNAHQAQMLWNPYCWPMQCVLRQYGHG